MKLSETTGDSTLIHAHKVPFHLHINQKDLLAISINNKKNHKINPL